MKKILFSLVICVLLAACGNSKTYTGGYAPDGTIHEMDATQAAAYVPGVELPQLTVIDFNATWCGPCRQLTPILEQLAQEYDGRVTFITCDVDNYGQLFEQWQMGESIPALLFISKDGSTEKLIGLYPADDIRNIINSRL